MAFVLVLVTTLVGWVMPLTVETPVAPDASRLEALPALSVMGVAESFRDIDKPEAAKFPAAPLGLTSRERFSPRGASFPRQGYIV